MSTLTPSENTYLTRDSPEYLDMLDGSVDYLADVQLSEKVIKRLQLLAERTRPWDSQPNLMSREEREEIAMMVASTFNRFEDFAVLGMKFLGFECTWEQLDIARYMSDKRYRKKMVAAQRGEAKSTLAALYAVWSIIQDNSYRVFIVSAGEDQASDVAILCVRLIMQWHLLCYLRPDAQLGDRTANTKFDVHCHLKALDKSASISCVGVTANLPGKRADLLIPDDIESPKNSMTQTMRDQLLALSKEFAAICTHGETLYLGTPQSKDSIYKTLPARGFNVRIWPGRFPTIEEEARYPAGALAPSILSAMALDPGLRTGCGLDGRRGAPTDPQRYDEAAEQDKELDYGPEGYSLQFMLDTSLTDAMRTRIRLQDLIVADFNHEAVPEVVWYSAEPRYRINGLVAGLTPPFDNQTVYCPASSSTEFTPYLHKLMTIDPAGSGGDEVAYAAGGSTQGCIHLFSTGGLRGGMTKENMDRLIDYCIEFGIGQMRVEANMGHGTVTALILQRIEERRLKEPLLPAIGVEDYYSKGQKELRIIDTIGPVTRRHKLIVHKRAIEDDWYWCQQHQRDKQMITSAFYQLANITTDRGSLVKDDRADAIQGLVQHLNALLVVADEKAQDDRVQQVLREFRDNPMGHKLPTPKGRGVMARLGRARR